MKFSLTREALRTGLDAVNSVVATRTPLPILSNTLIETTDGGMLRFSATDLDVTLHILVPSQIHDQGAITLPSKKLSEIAREMPDGEIALDVVGSDATIKSGRSRFRLNGMSKDEFPNAADMDWSEAAEVPARVLKELIAHTSFAVSNDETRPILNGVLWEIRESEMRMVATNGHRLAKVVHHMNGSTPSNTGDRIIHPKALARIEKLFGQEEVVQIVFEENRVGFRTATVQIVARLIEGPYPNYEQVIPRDNDKTLLADKQSLVSAVRRMAIVASDQTHRIRCSLGGPMLRLSVQTPDLGEASEEVPVEYTGDPMEIGFNANYLLEVLKYLPSEAVRMTFKGPERATILRPGSTDAMDLEFLIMPLRLLD